MFIIYYFMYIFTIYLYIYQPRKFGVFNIKFKQICVGTISKNYFFQLY